MATLTPQDASVAGIVDTLGAAAGGGDQFSNNGLCLLHVKNASGGSINVTIDDPNSVNPGSATSFNPDVVVAVGAGVEKLIGPFPPFRFNDANGMVQVAYSAVTSVTVSVVRLRT